MRHFHPPIHAAIVAVTVVAGLASYQGVDKLALAKGGATYGTPSEPGHEPSSSTSTTVHHEHSSTTSTTTHHEPTPPSTTPPSTTPPSTVPHEPGPITSTTVHHEPPRPSTSTTSSISTTGHHEPPPSTTPPTTAPHTTTPPTVPQMSFYCMSGFSQTVGVAKCSWAQTNAGNFGHYRLTRELVGTPRQTIFESSDQSTWYYYDIGLQAGAEYSYIIEAYDTAGNLIGRGGPVHVTCCGGTATS